MASTCSEDRTHPTVFLGAGDMYLIILVDKIKTHFYSEKSIITAYFQSQLLCKRVVLRIRLQRPCISCILKSYNDDLLAGGDI